jgi:hypothetical protein
MNAFSTTLRVLAPIFFLVAALHLILGAGAEVLLGATLSPDTLSDPVLDSQNRFYGVVFAIYGVILYLAASNVPKYSPLLRWTFGVFFAGGLARFVSIAIVGIPSLPVLGLMASELLLPPVLFIWLSIVEKSPK